MASSDSAAFAKPPHQANIFVRQQPQSQLRRLTFSPPHTRRFSALLLATALFVQTAHAQGIAVSSTAAWSSQIVAFWGALIIGSRASSRLGVTNGVTSIIYSLSVLRRSRTICKLLRGDDWFLRSGMNNGKTRMDVVLICWRTPEELQHLALRVSLQIEVVGDTWEVLVCGRQLKMNVENGRVWWIQSPRCEDFCAARLVETSEIYFPFSTETAAEALVQFYHRASADNIAIFLNGRRESRPSRCAYVTEVRSQLQEEATLARHFTSYSQHTSDVPFVQLHAKVGLFGSSRAIVMECASRMYAVLHITIAVAVGLMAASSGRGLAVWVMAIRPTLENFGTGGVVGNDIMASLLSFQDTSLDFETGLGSHHVAGDSVAYGLSWWQFMGAVALPVVELSLISTGWLYGALRVKRFSPQGVVGHGMLWLSALVALSLSARAIIGIRHHVSGRLVGLFRTHEYVRFIVGKASVPISVDKIVSQPTADAQLRLIAGLLRECTDDTTAVLTASGLLRRPETGTALAHYLAVDVMKFQYKGDSLAEKGDPAKPVSVATVYPWFQASCCVILTASCACVSVAYAYFLVIPTWVKPMVEVVLVISAVWFATLERAGELCHTRETYVCHMVATLVVSAVWYVGVDGLG